jgi:hypothetical protein
LGSLAFIHQTHPIIFKFEPAEFSSISSAIERHLPFASTIFDRACCEKANAATVTEWLIMPAPKTLPGTTMLSFSSECRLILLMFTFTRVRLGLESLPATSCQMGALLSLDFFFSKRIRLIRSGFVLLIRLLGHI